MGETPEDNDEEDAQALGCTARLEIRWAGKMADDERQDVADWLRVQASALIAEGHNYAAMYTASLDPED
jgi:hypothetical protein